MLPGHARARADQRERGDRHGLRVEADRPDDSRRTRSTRRSASTCCRRGCSRSRSRPCSSRRSRGSPTRGDIAGFRDTVSHGLRQINFLLIPARVVSAVLAEPIVRLLYERGAFEPDQTHVVAGALAAFSLGLTFNGMMLMLNRGFFSLQAPWMPTVVALANLVAQHRALRRLLPRRRLGDPARDLAREHRRRRRCSFVALRRRVGRLDLTRDGPRRSCCVDVASAALGGVAYGVWCVLDDALGRSFAAQLVSLGAALVVGGAVYLAACRVLRVREIGGATIAARPLPPGLIAHGPSTHPQLLDHRPHRPWEVDAGRPHPAAHRHGRRPRHEGAAARLDGARARARDHDQGAGRARALEGAPAEPDRHARPRRLHVRGLALAAGVRGRAARRRRRAGDRGADARERVPRDREQPRDRPGREQDRPAAGRSRRRGRRGRRPDRRRPGRRPPHLGQDRRRRRGRARRDRRADPAAGGRSRRARRAR